MDQNDLQEARTNPEFLNYLAQTQKDALETENISALYEVLDTLLLLDLNEDNRIDNIYENILKIAFDNVEKLLNNDKKLTLEDDEFYYIRAFYEHAIEKWSHDNIKGTKELLFVLSGIVDDERLSDAFDTHIIACSKNMSLDEFYDKKVDVASEIEDEKHGYFIVNFQFDTKEYLRENKQILDKEYEELRHLLG